MLALLLGAAQGVAVPSVGVRWMPFSPQGLQRQSASVQLLGLAGTPVASAQVRGASIWETGKDKAPGGTRLELPLNPGLARVFPAGCSGTGAELPGLLVGGVRLNGETWRPVPAGLVDASPSAAPGKGGGLLFLTRPLDASGGLSLSCGEPSRGSAPAVPGYALTLRGVFPAGWSRLRTLVSVARSGRPLPSVLLSPEAGAWRWERAGGG